MASESELSFFADNYTNGNSALSFQSSRDQLDTLGQARPSSLPDFDEVDSASHYDHSRILSGYSSPSDSPLQASLQQISTATPTLTRNRTSTSRTAAPPDSKVSLASLAAEALESSDTSRQDGGSRIQNEVKPLDTRDERNASSQYHSVSERDRSPQYYGGDRAFWEHHRSSFKTVAERERDDFNKGSLPKSSVESSFDVRALLNRHESIFATHQDNEPIEEQHFYKNSQNKNLVSNDASSTAMSGGSAFNSNALRRRKGQMIENVTFNTSVGNDRNMPNNQSSESESRDELKIKDARGFTKNIDIYDHLPNRSHSSNARATAEKENKLTYPIKKSATDVRRDQKREVSIENEKRQVACANFDRSRELVVDAIQRASHSTGLVVKESVESYANWMIKHLKNATLALDALARDSNFSTDENSWGGSFGAEVAACGRHNPCAAAWLRDLGRGFLHPSSPPNTVSHQAPNLEHQDRPSSLSSSRHGNSSALKPSFEGTESPLTPGDGAGAGLFGAWGLTNPPPVISKHGSIPHHHAEECILRPFPLPSLSQEFPSTTATNESSNESDIEIVMWCSSNMVELIEHLSHHINNDEQVQYASETRKTLESLCEAIGQLTVACGGIVERLQERDKLRRTQLRDSIKHMEQIAASTARQNARAEKSATAASINAMEKTAMIKGEELAHKLQLQLEEHHQLLKKAEAEKEEIKHLLLGERSEHEKDIAKMKNEEREKITAIEASHDEELQELRKKFEESFSAVQQSKENELEDLRVLLETQQVDSRTEAERQVKLWKEKATNAEARVREALSGRAAAETRARDVLDREIHRLRETHSEQMKQFSAQLELKKRQYESDLSNERTSFLLKERELKFKCEETVERCRIEKEQALKRVAQSGAAGASAVERKVRDEYEDLIRVVKATHEGELRRIGVEVMRLRRELQRTSQEKSMRLSSSGDMRYVPVAMQKGTDTLFHGLDSSGQDLIIESSSRITPPVELKDETKKSTTLDGSQGTNSMTLTSLSLSDPVLPPPSTAATETRVKASKVDGVGLPPRPTMTSSPSRGRRGAGSRSSQHEHQRRDDGFVANDDEMAGTYGAALDDYIKNSSC